ncbi:hypothetical protein [Paenibacillus eucommiae]|uniref:DUF3221 domain-containing protein n=1 Tax=Paenibacillus eucommiae TaxID=1355755 RepID=A0ABS4J6C2_9BACL|nr:hypothetical protein [Paenibacillus eucommiae]MBP1995382.1 hypothetical protein [Paenibacillus eucommiae]
MNQQRYISIIWNNFTQGDVRRVLIKRISVLLVVVFLIMTACNRNPIQSFEETIDSINTNEFVVNCSDQVNRDKKGPINSLGYLCKVGVTSTTKLEDSEGNSIQFKDFSQGDIIRIILSKPKNISQDHRSFDAKEIVLMDAKP